MPPNQQRHGLIWRDPNWGSQNSKSLAGWADGCLTEVGGINVDFPAGSPVTTGPGGTVDNGSLDNGNSSTHGFVAVIAARRFPGSCE